MVLISSERTFGPYSFSINVDEDDEQFSIIFKTSTDKVVLHWGVGTVKTKEWKNPLEISGISIPDQTSNFDQKAAQTQFLPAADEYQIEIVVMKSSAVLQINFVLKRENAWFNNNSNDYFDPNLASTAYSSRPNLAKAKVTFFQQLTFSLGRRLGQDQL